MYRLMIVEDDLGIAGAIGRQAEMWGMCVRIVEDLHHVMAEFEAFQPHLVLLDVGLPCYDGYHWCSEIRRISSVPVIFISSAADQMSMVMAMNMGADDFIAKPFDLSVLMAKIRAILRRTYDFTAVSPLLEYRGAVLSTADSELVYAGQKIPLTRNEYRILLCLLENRGRVVSREKLMQRLWETDSFVDENTLTVNVNRLRRKLAAAGLENYIATRVGVGYLLEQEEA